MTNRVIDPVTLRVAAVDPVTRTRAGIVRPVMALRTAGGNTFSTLQEMRQWARGEDIRAGTAGSFGNAPFRSRGFSSAEARRSAGNIYLRSVERMRANQIRQGGIAGEERRLIGTSESSAPGRLYGSSSMTTEGGERFSVPGAPPRMHRLVPLEQREFTSPRIPERAFIAPVTRSDRGAAGSFTGSGRSMWGSGGRRFSGGMCRGRC